MQVTTILRKALYAAIFMPSMIFAAAGINPETGKIDLMGVKKPTLSNTGTINTSTNPVDWSKLKNVPAGFADGVDNAGGASSLGVATGTSSGFSGSISSPTSVINFDSTQFIGALTGGGTAYMRVDPATFTLLGPTIDASELPSDGYASTYVNTTGDAMTGVLTVVLASVTVSGTGGIGTPVLESTTTTTGLTIRTKALTPSSGKTGNITIQPGGAGAGTHRGGSLTLYGADTSAVFNSSVTLSGGDANTPVTGGELILEGGNGSSTSDGANITIRSGASGTSAGVSGDVIFNIQDGVTTDGSFKFQGAGTTYMTITSSGLIQTGDGSTIAPSYSFNNATADGLFRLAASTISIGVNGNGADRYRIDITSAGIKLVDDASAVICSGSNGGALTTDANGFIQCSNDDSGSGGASTLAIATGTAASFAGTISSPTAVVNFNSSQFVGALTGNATAFIGLDPSSVTLLGPSIGLTSEVTGTLPVANGGTALAVNPIVEIPISGTSLKGSATNGAGDSSLLAESSATATNSINWDYMKFIDGTTKYAYFDYDLPPGFDASTVTFKVNWTSTGGVVGTSVTWCLQGVALANDDAIATAYGTAVCVADYMLATDDLHVSPLSDALTLGNTWAAGDNVHWRIYRDADSVTDTLGADARLMSLRIRYQRNSYTD